MEPFRILCPTCSTKLVVRQAELVGRTVPCPKCKSAIHVVRTGEVPWNPGNVSAGGMERGVQERHVGTVNSEAITKADAGDWDIDQLDRALGNLASQETQRVERGAVLENSVRDREVLGGEIEGSYVDGGYEVPAQVIPPSAWQSPSAAARRQWLILGLVGLSGCLLAFLGFVAFLKTLGGKTAVKPSVPVVNQPGPEIAKPGPEVAESGLVVAKPVPGVAEPVPGVAEPGPGVAESVPGVAETVPGDKRVGSVDVQRVEGSQGEEVVGGERAALMGQDVGERVQEEGQGDTEGLPEIFREFMPVFDRSSQAGWTDLGKEGDRTIAQEISLENAQDVFRDEYYPPGILLPSFEDRMARGVVRVESPPMPMLERLEWFNRLSGHAVGVDWMMMRLVEGGLDRPVGLQFQGGTLGEVLGQISESVGATVEELGEGFYVLSPKPERMTAKLAADGSTGLGGISEGLPEGKASQIVSIVCGMLGVDECGYEGGKLVWGESTNAVQQVQVLAGLDSVRGLELGGGRVREELFEFNEPWAWYEAYAAAQTRMPLDLFQLEERPVVEILQRAARGSGVQLMIDWPAVWSHGLHPNRMGLSLLRGRNFLEVATKFLEDHSLVLVPLDRKTWVLTTEGQRRTMVRVVAVRTDRGMSISDMRVALRGLVPRGVDGRSLFRAEEVPGVEGAFLLRISPPNSSQLRDEELRSVFGLRGGELEGALDRTIDKK